MTYFAMQSMILLYNFKVQSLHCDCPPSANNVYIRIRIYTLLHVTNCSDVDRYLVFTYRKDIEHELANFRIYVSCTRTHYGRCC